MRLPRRLLVKRGVNKMEPMRKWDKISEKQKNRFRVQSGRETSGR